MSGRPYSELEKSAIEVAASLADDLVAHRRMLREARACIADELIPYILAEVADPDDTIKAARKTLSGIDHLLLAEQQ